MIINMTNEIKTRNPRSEGMYSLLWNGIVLLIISLAAFAVRPEIGPIGHRNMLAVNMLDSVLALVFMYLLEKYTISVSGMYEKTVITALSGLYSFILIGIINLLFFSSLEKLILDSAFKVIKIGAVIATDMFLEHIFGKNARPRLLIIGSREKNHSRMKKIKYGVMKNYDAWYEDIKTHDSENSIGSLFADYDAICVFDSLTEEQYRDAVNTAVEMNKDLFIVPQIIDVGKTNAHVVLFDDVLTLYMPKKFLNKTELFFKRIVDIILSVIGLAFAIIPMAMIAAVIKLTSPGPIFYKQVRLTYHKREFDIYKFRTMVPDAEKLSGPKFAEKDDPRITPIGRVLRACRLDELPQLINVLKGDMSIVGPRPERPMFVEQFEKEIENYDHRFEVKAGLTSLSHVYGRYSTYIYDRTYYDLYYISHYSILLDLKIMLLTTKIVFLKSAAEGEDRSKQNTSINPITEASRI